MLKLRRIWEKPKKLYNENDARNLLAEGWFVNFKIIKLQAFKLKFLYIVELGDEERLLEFYVLVGAIYILHQRARFSPV